MRGGDGQWRLGVAHQLRLLTRDHRIVLLVGMVMLLTAAALAAVAVGNAGIDRESMAARAAEARTWAALPRGNPHAAAHFGRYAFKPVSALAAIDRGMLDSLGVAVRLESHSQNPATLRPMDGGTVLADFARLDPATMVELLGPLLLILAAVATFAGPNADALLRQEVGAGARPSAMLLGRLIGLAILVPLLVAPVLLGGALVAGTAGLTRLALLALGLCVYLLGFLGLTLGASAWFGAARPALIAMLGFWAGGTLVLPRVAPAIAEAVRPTLSAAALEAAATEEVLKGGPEAPGTSDARMSRLKATMLARYHVRTVERLPIDFGGVAFFEGETLSSAIYARHMAALYNGYAAQALVQRALAFASPLLAIRPWSAALAGTDLAAHRHFLVEAEAYRYRYVQALNRDIILHRQTSDGDYLADIPVITRSVSLQPTSEPLKVVLARQWPDLAILICWAAASIALAVAALGHRTRRL